MAVGSSVGVGTSVPGTTGAGVFELVGEGNGLEVGEAVGSGVALGTGVTTGVTTIVGTAAAGASAGTAAEADDGWAAAKGLKNFSGSA
jgi:hypothetical protein